MKLLLTTLLSLLSILSYSQAFNPFNQNIHFNPEPTTDGFYCGTIQEVIFTQGLTTSDSATQWQTDPLIIKICISGFEFNGSDQSAVTGSYSIYFNWVYDSNCVIGTQNQTLIGTGSNPIFPNILSTGDIKVSLFVPTSLPNNTVLSVNVSLEVPSYMVYNSLPDDNESTQTQSFCNPVILPIDLKEFFISEYNCSPLLSWVSSDSVDIWRNGNKIAKVIGNRYLDTVDDGRYEYQLKSIDIDGQISLSNIVSIVINCNTPSISIYPNPASDILNISEVLNVSIFNIFGRKLISIVDNRIDISLLSPGLYILKYDNEWNSGIFRFTKLN